MDNLSKYFHKLGVIPYCSLEKFTPSLPLNGRSIRSTVRFGHIYSVSKELSVYTRMGRLDTLAAYLDYLRPGIYPRLADRRLVSCRGDVDKLLKNRF